MDKKKILLISYFPLINTEGLVPGSYMDDTEDVEDLQRRLNESHPVGRADGVMWVYYPFDTLDDAAVIPVLMMDRADEIADHLVVWAEGEVDRRFDLYICTRSEGYAVMLVPNMQQSILRWKTARLMFHEDISDAADFEILFTPLGAICPQAETYNQVKSCIANPTMVGFVDSKKIDRGNPSFNASDIKIVGPLRISEADDMVKTLIDDMFKEAINEE